MVIRIIFRLDQTMSQRLSVLAFIWVTLMPFIAQSQQAQNVFPEVIAVSARPWRDSVTLRWAPVDYDTWQVGVRYGYKLERYVLAQDGELVQPERTVLHSDIRPLPESEWEHLVQNNRYAAIAAQALFGDVFEVDLNKNDIISIVNKVRENDQRFSFTLFACDMSPEVAEAAGLWFTDTSVARGEKYLYRIVINSADSLRGSIFIAPDEPYQLPRPEGLHAEFEEHLVKMRWDKESGHYYTAWQVERSEDGKSFSSLSDTPLLTMAPTEAESTRYNYALDSLSEMGKTYYYRVRGITPFGEKGPPSAVVHGRMHPVVHQPPYIRSATTSDNATIVIEWDFPVADNSAIQGFEIERSPDGRASFNPLSGLVSSQVRQFHDKSPGSTNYYRVLARGMQGEHYPSQVYFAHLVDSIPPSRPALPKAHVDDDGRVLLEWNPNAESDMYGYRVFKANLENEELAQITTAPVRENRYRDTVDLHTLNEAVYYRIMAVDRSQNQSDLSLPLRVLLPDKVLPQPPVFLPAESNSKGAHLRWVPSASEDVVRYELYRKSASMPEWERIAVLDHAADSLYRFTDDTAIEEMLYHYTVLAIDDAGLESAPSAPVGASKSGQALRPPVTWKKPQLLREENRLTLRWDYEEGPLQFFRLYSHQDDHRPVLYKTLSGDTREFSDLLIPGRRYAYMILAVFPNGKTSALSEPLHFQY